MWSASVVGAGLIAVVKGVGALLLSGVIFLGTKRAFTTGMKRSPEVVGLLRSGNIAILFYG